jgi:predicted P-loop ATPase
VRNYLKAQVWDGVPRIEQLFQYFLGAEDNIYTREVARKWFTAAVARVFQPGIKFDTMLVFVGKAGIGKSYLIDKLGGKWFSDTSVDLRNKKDSMEDVQGVWLMEWGELTSFRTASVEAVKAYVSKRKDRFRAAYARRVETHLRQCVFAGTTNRPEFLSDPDGNRKFWPILVDQVPRRNSVYTDVTEELRGQLWAEACYLYAQGEPLILSAEADKLAEQVQLRHTEIDDREDVIREYINKPVPMEWFKMSKGERAAFLGIGDFGSMPQADLQAAGDLARRDKVSIAEIWVEALGGDLKSMTKLNTRVVHDIMRNMPGWEIAKNPLQFGYFPRARGYVRSGSEVLTHF